MTGDWESKQNIFEFRARTDIVYDQVPPSVGSATIHNNPNMREITRQHPGDEVARLII